MSKNIYSYHSDTYEPHFDKPFFNTMQAAAFLNCSSYTLRRSRSTGQLFGVISPTYKKGGRNVVYERATLETWESRFSEQSNTAA